MSCHLYPIRHKKVGDLDALNYHRWEVCKAAVVLGQKENVRVYEFLREPLIRMFGDAWYEDLLDAVAELKRRGYIDW